MERVKVFPLPVRLQSILNRCFDDMESFLSRLQQAAEASGALTLRKKKKKKSKKQSAEGKGYKVTLS